MTEKVKGRKAAHFTRRAWLFPVMVIAGFSAIWGLIYAPWSSPNAPAWVQAIGSVAAIFTAVGISYWQYRQTKQGSINEAVEYMERVHLDTAWASGYLDGITFDMKDGNIPRERLPRAIRLAKAIHEDLRTYDQVRIADGRYARRWQSYVRSIRNLIEELEQDLLEGRDGANDTVRRHLHVLKSDSERLRQDFDEFMSQIGRRA